MNAPGAHAKDRPPRLPHKAGIAASTGGGRPNRRGRWLAGKDADAAAGFGLRVYRSAKNSMPPLRSTQMTGLSLAGAGAVAVNTTRTAPWRLQI